MKQVNRRRRGHRRLLASALAGVSLVASGCAVPIPGPANKLPPHFDSRTGVDHADLQYGPDAAQVLNLYLPEPSRRPAPVVIYMHSGGFVAGDRTGVSQAIQHEVLRGYAVASIEYHLSPQSLFPVALQDVKTAIRWAKARGPQYALRPDEVFTAGYSAGGNLAAMAALTPGRFEPENLPDDLAAVDSTVRGAVTMSGVLNVNAVGTNYGTWGPGFVGQYLGCPSGCDPNLMAQASPINYVTPSAPPMFIVNGYWDGLIRARDNGLEMALRYAKAGRVRVGYYDLVLNQGHDLDLDGMNVTVLDFWLDAVRDGRIA